jgi:hypothetical protein
MAAKTSSQPLMPSTPPAVNGRKHMEIQTENFLEELTDSVPEVDEETQTDFYMDRCKIYITCFNLSPRTLRVHVLRACVACFIHHLTFC